MGCIVYLRLKKHLTIQKRQPIQLSDIAHLSTSSKHKYALENEVLYRMRKEDHELLILDGFLVIEHLNNTFPDLEFQLIGP